MAESRLIQGRYRLLDVIGRGGMGEVWRAVDEALGRRVAVKCLKPMGRERDGSFATVLRERFRREARVAAALQHRGVTVVHDFGEYEGVLYLVMELLEGRNLSQLLEENRQRPLPVRDVVAELVERAVALAKNADPEYRDTATVRDQVTSTLTAAVADPTAEAAVTSGRLVSPLSYAGFGEVDLTDAVATPLHVVRQQEKKPAAQKPAQKSAQQVDQRALNRAHDDLERAEDALEEAEQAFDKARSDRHQARLDVKRAQLAVDELEGA